MNLSLSDLVINSEKRRNILLVLDGENRSIEEIGHLLDESPLSIRLNIKKLSDCGLVLEDNGTFRLSDLASPIVKNLKALMKSLTFLEDSIDYWTKHDLTPIPDFLLLRLEELGHFELIEPEIESMFDISQVYLENIRKSKEIFTFFSVFHPASPSIHAELAKKGSKLSLCMTEPVAERFFIEYPPESKKLLETRNANTLICRKKVNLPVFTVSDRFMAIRFSDKRGNLGWPLIISYEEGALEWGRELYRYYENVSDKYE